MRRLIFILMIALLPLRGWMGEAMATEMAAMHLIANKTANTPASAIFNAENSVHPSFAIPASSALPADCEVHADMAPDTSKSNQSCTHCQACHAAGLVSTVQINSGQTTHNPSPHAHASLFTSANIALSQKPPIL